MRLDQFLFITLSFVEYIFLSHFCSTARFTAKIIKVFPDILPICFIKKFALMLDFRLIDSGLKHLDKIGPATPEE